MDYKMAIAEVVDTLIKDGKASGKDSVGLAEACGVTKQSVYKWRHGKTSMDVDRVPDLCEYFDITPTEFFDMCDEAAFGDEHH